MHARLTPLALVVLLGALGCPEKDDDFKLEMQPIHTAQDVPAAPAALPAEPEPDPAEAPVEGGMTDEEIAQLRKVGAIPFDSSGAAGGTDGGEADPAQAILGNWTIMASRNSAQSPFGSVEVDMAGSRLRFGATHYEVDVLGRAGRVDFKTLAVRGDRIEAEIKVERQRIRQTFQVKDNELIVYDSAGTIVMRAERAD